MLNALPMRLLSSVLGGGPVPRDENRERLAAAISKRDATQQLVNQARARVERLQAVVDESDKATRASAAATHEAREARQRWLDSGCTYTAAKTLQEADEAAAAAKAVADRTARDSAPVARELARSAENLRSLESVDLVGFVEQIATAMGLVLAQSSEARDLLARFERSADVYRTLRAELMALIRVLAPEWNEPQSAVKSYDAARIIRDSLYRGRIQSWEQERAEPRARDSLDGTAHDEAMIERLAARWRACAAKLFTSLRC